MEVQPVCNGILEEVDSKPAMTCRPPEVTGTNGKLDDSVIVCPANGLVSEIPALSTVNCVTSSQEVQLSSFADNNDDCKESLIEGTVVSEPASDADCTTCTVNSERKPSLSNSIPLLSIPQPDHSHADDKSFSLLSSLSSFTAEDATVEVMPPSVFSVPCTGKESDSFTDVNLDDNAEPPKSVNTLRVEPVVSAESSRHSSPNRLQVASSTSSLHLDDAIVQSVLSDDDDDDDTSHAVGSSRHSTSSIATNTDSAAFRRTDGLPVIEPDGASFEEISLQSFNALDSRNADAEQTVTSGSKRSSFANFFAR